MKAVLLSGGSGKRLWPMSNDGRSKQFLKVLASSDADETRISMLQRVWAQVASVGLREEAFICAPKSHHDIIESQVGTVRLIEEPICRDTFAAITLASLYLADVQGCSDHDVMAVIPVDPFVDESYFQTVRALESALHQSDAQIALMGVRPTVPTSKFGYIRIATDGKRSCDCQRVAEFVEKPTVDLATTLIAEGALWNCGVFAFRIGFIRNQLAEMCLPSTYRGLQEAYATLPKRSFDYEVVEKVSDIVVVPYAGMWEDLGTWGSLSSQMKEAFVGQGVAVDCENTHVINELGVPLVTMGMQNAIIVATPDGILVADKQATAGIKDVIAPYSSYPMYEERRWGTYRVLDHQKFGDGTEALTKSISLRKDSNLSYQSHEKRAEVWTIVEGHGEVALGSTVQSVGPGDVIRIEPGEWHAVRANEPMRFIEVQYGIDLTEADIVRVDLSWGEIVERDVASVG